MMSLYGKNLIPILMIIAAVWTAFGFLFPHYSTIQDLRAQKQTYASALDDANQVRILRSTLLAKFDSFSDQDRQRLQVLLPAKADGVALARDVSGLAGVFGISIDTISFSEPTAGAADTNSAASAPAPGGGTTFGAPAPASPTSPDTTMTPQPVPVQAAATAGTLQLKLTFKARYIDFMNFLRELERSLELADVTSISVSRSEASGAGSANQNTVPTLTNQDNVYQFDVTLQTYWFQ